MDSSNRHEKPSIPFNFLKKSLPILLSLSCIGCRNNHPNTPSGTFRDPEPQVEITAAEPDTSCKNLKKLPANYNVDDFDICVHNGTRYNATNINFISIKKKGEIVNSRIFVEEKSYLGLQSCDQCTIVNFGQVGVQNLTNSKVTTTSTFPTVLYVRSQANTRIELLKK